MIRTTLPLLLAALLMLHDAGLANHGHDEMDDGAHQGKALPVAIIRARANQMTGLKMQT
jgi:hypothetical protein